MNHKFKRAHSHLFCSAARGYSAFDSRSNGFVTEDDLKRRERKTGLEIDERVETLKKVELFFTLTEEERRALAQRVRVAPFARGEIMTHQGAQAHWLYVIISGVAEVQLSVDGGETSEKIAALHSGDFSAKAG